MMYRKEIAALRTQLRDTNIQYSALVRSPDADDKANRLNDLDARRRALMTLIGEASLAAPMRILPAGEPTYSVERAA